MRLVWSEDALNDRDDLALYIAERDWTAALRVLDRITEVLEILEVYPLAGRTGRMPDTRELVITDTPYLAVYRIENDAPVVLRLMHHSREWPPEV